MIRFRPLSGATLICGAPLTNPRLRASRPVRGSSTRHQAIAECIRSGGVWEAESHIEWLDLVSTPATADRDASVTMERINLLENTAKAFRRKCEFDQMRKVPFVRKPDQIRFCDECDESSRPILLRFAPHRRRRSSA